MQTKFDLLGSMIIQHDFYGTEAAPLDLYVYQEDGRPHQGIKVLEKGREFQLITQEGIIFEERGLLGIHLEDPGFFNYTDLEVHRDHILFIYPRMGEPVMKSQSYEWLPKMGRICSFPMSEAEFEALQRVDIQRLEGGPVQGLPVVKGPFSGAYQVDIRNFPPGGYEVGFSLSNGQKLISKFFALGDSQIGKHLIVVSAYFQKNYAQMIHFAARKVYWRYNIIGNEKDWESVNISAKTLSEGIEIPFDKLENEGTIPGGKKAKQWITKVPISLSQKPKVKVMLTSNTFVNGLQLPDASSENLISYRPDNKVEGFLADIFMYL